jgi:hypothetical protein
MRRRLRVGEDPEIVPWVVCHGLCEDTPAGVRGGGSAAAEQGVTQRRQLLLRHERRISDVAVGAWRAPVLRQAWCAVRPAGVGHGFLRGMASVRFAPEGYGTLHTQGR